MNENKPILPHEFRGDVVKSSDNPIKNDYPNEYITETISVPYQKFFEDMDVIEIGINVVPFYDLAHSELYSEYPMVNVNYRGNTVRLSISDEHKNKPRNEQQKIAQYAIRWVN